MSRRAQDNLISLGLLAVFICLLIASTHYGPRARMVPLPIACIGIVLVFAQLYWQNFRRTDALKVDLMEVVGADRKIAEVEEKFAPVLAEVAPQDEKRLASYTFRQELAAFGMVLVLVACLLVFGPVPAVAIFTTGYLVLSKQTTWLKSALIGFGCAAFLYVTFGVSLGQQLNHGLLAPYIGRYIVNF
jgi:hypothetical protein